MSSTPDAASKVGRSTPVTARLPLAFVLVSLFALAALPVLANRYIGTYQSKLRRLIEPARDQITELHLSQSLAGALLRDLLNTGDSRFRERYLDALQRERRAYERLGVLTTQLGGVAKQRYDSLTMTESRWHQRIAELLREPRKPEEIEQILADEVYYEHTLVAASTLDEALSYEAALLRRRIERAERMVLVLTIGLVTLAVAAGVIVARLGSKLRMYAMEAEERRREVENVLESKVRMTRGITHDLKNPLNVIVGHADLLEEGVRGELKPEQRDAIGRIKRAARSMLGLIETLLELARAEAGQIRIERKPVDLRVLIDEAVEGHQAVAQRAGLRLESSPPKGLGEVDADPLRVIQVLGNLISNAIKYTPSGFVRVSANESDGARPGRWVGISVEDSGPGIPQDQQEHVFEEFSRLHPPQAEGAGLGLAISRRIARLMGGDITVSSEPGKGSRFTLWLPR